MTRKIRRILFFICAFLFLLTAPSVILYSQGYRIDFEQKKLVKTGAFYFKIAPKGATIFLNGKSAKKTDFFFGSVFIENLTPKKYLVEIKKSDYQNWKKNLEIKETQVIEGKNIALVPNELKFELLNKQVIDFFSSPTNSKMILKTDSGLKLYDLDRQIKSHLIDKQNISKKEEEVLDLIWSSDENNVLIKTEVDRKTNYFLLDITKNPVLAKKLDFLAEAKNIIWHPNDNQKMFFQKQDNLFEINIKESIPMPILENIITYKIIGNDIYWLSNEGFVYKGEEKINFLSFEIKKDIQCEIYVFNSQIFLKEKENFYLFNKNSKSFELIDNNVHFLAISPDFKKLCFANDFEVSILFLQEETGQPQKEAGTKLFLTRFSQEIEKIFWWTNHYLIINNDSKIKIIEIDDRDEIQIWNLAEFDNSKIYFNQKNKKLYVLDNNNLFVSEITR